MRYCSHCGNEVNENAVLCVKCGCVISNAQSFNNDQRRPVSSNQDIVHTISQRILANGIIWIVIAAIQILVGVTEDWTFLIVGVLNLISSIQDLNYSKSFPLNPIGIVSKMKPLVGSIITLIYNLVIGGVIGVAGSIYYFVAVRGYVMKNEKAFIEIEQQRVISKV